jgi:alpha-tubulin suppressor-like RCC1 family protein
MSLIWQQQATLASFVDTEFAGATFTARSLTAITPDLKASARTITAEWSEPGNPWATPQYTLTGATSAGGANATTVYTGTDLSYTQTMGSVADTGTLDLTDISAGGTHACGIARGQLYCWGTSSAGALGLGSTTSTSTPTLVSGLAGKVVTDVSAGSDHTCAVADGAAWCWGNGGSGRTGLNGTGNTSTPTAVTTASGGLSGRTVTAISAGGTHTCAVAAGAAYCWGLGTSGQLGNSASATSNVAVAVTTASGGLSGRTVTAISAGTSHSCAVADGLAYCWGLGTNGRLGNSGTGTSNYPVAVTATGVLNGLSVSAVSAGDTFSCAVADGRAYCWGQTTNGRLGNGTTGSSNVTSPVAVTGTVAASANVTAISAGAGHACAIAGGAAHCWGLGSSGQLGNGSSSANNGASVAVTAASGILSGRTLTTISAGTSFTCTTGATPGACWGAGAAGQLGHKASPTTSTTPVNVAITGPICPTGAVRNDGTECSLVQGTAYWARLGYTIGTWTAPTSDWEKVTTKTRDAISPAATSKAATALTLGWDQVSDLSKSYAEFTLQRSTSSSGSNPVTLYKGGRLWLQDRGGFAKRTSNLDVTQVSAGSDHTCALLEGVAYCWGDNDDGELGTGNTTDVSVPTAVVATGVLSGRTVTAISAGESHTCAVADGGVYCWGYNADGRVGVASTADKLSPVAVGTFTKATDVSAGYWHSCALVDGSVYCWGDNTRGQLGGGTVSTYETTPVLVQGLLAGKKVTAISAGGAHTCAIADAKMYCWGSNVSGQLGINSSGTTTNSSVPVAVLASGTFTNTNVTGIAAGYAHTCALAGGKAYCWAYNAYGQVGDNSTTNRTVATAVSAPWATSATLTSISAGQYSSCVLASGKAYCWGEGDSGRLGNNSTTDRSTPMAVTATGVMTGTLDQVAAGEAHGCAVSNNVAYCWGLNSPGRLGNNSTTASNVPVAVQAVAGPACATGASLITPGTCSLTPGTNYYYRLTYTVDGNSSTSSGWVAIKTSS